MKRYNIALTCKHETQNTCLEQLSQTLDPNNTSVYTLGQNSLPHITLAQFDAHEKQITDIVSAIEKSQHKNSTIYVSIAGMYYEDFHPVHEKYYYGLHVEKTTTLESLHEFVLSEILAPFKIETTLRRYGETYAPHFTLGLKETPLDKNTFLHPALLDPLLPKIEMEIHIGLCESYGRLPHILT